MKKRLAFVATLLAFGLTACTSVTPQSKSLISSSYQNAAAFDKVVQAGNASPEAVKAWIHSDVQSWKALDDWANGRNPTPAVTTTTTTVTQ